MLSLTWPQVWARRLARHALIEPQPADRLAEVVGEVCAIHAQIMAAADVHSARRIVPFLQTLLQECPPKDLPRHAESALPVVNRSNRSEFESILTTRRDELSPAQARRVERVLRKLPS